MKNLLEHCVQPIKASEVAEKIRNENHLHWVCLYDVTHTEIIATGWTESERPRPLKFPAAEGRVGIAVATHQSGAIAMVEGFKFSCQDQNELLTRYPTAVFVFRSPSNDRIVGAIEAWAQADCLFTFDEVVRIKNSASKLMSDWHAINHPTFLETPHTLSAR